MYDVKITEDPAELLETEPAPVRITNFE